MNRANGIGPSRSISARIRVDERLVLADGVEVGRRVASDAERGLHRSAVSQAPRTTSRAPGPTSVWPPSRTGIGASAAAARQVAQPRVGDRVGEQQVGGEAVLRPRPAALVRAEPVGERAPGCR